METANTLSATEAAKRIEAGSLTAEALVASCIERIDARVDAVGAWKSFDRSLALKRARQLDKGPRKGLLHGLPFGVKDIIETADLPTGYGSPIYEGHRPAADAPCVALSLESGGVLMGKTVSTEFASRHPGKTRNPHNPNHTPGGSSSGSGAAVADFQVPLAFGTQTTGSVIRPAAYCGCVGYKPSYGLIPAYGVKENTRSFDTVGLYARTIDDIALFRAGVMAIPLEPLADVSVKGLRVAFCRTMVWDRASAATREKLEAAAATLARAGAAVSDLTLGRPFDGFEATGKTVSQFEFTRALTYERTHHPDKLSEVLRKTVLEPGLKVTFADYQAALQRLAACRAWLRDAMASYDVILTPSAPDEAPEGLSHTGDPCFNMLQTWTYTPAVTLPLYKGPRGLPIGVQFMGDRGADMAMLAAAKAAQAVLAEG
jgi:Asp-tRNA(Asn)/Glu-tRNA(Gln) amidotransferase A subunit family amidase